MEHIFAPNGGYSVYYPSKIFCSTRGFEDLEISIQKYFPGHYLSLVGEYSIILRVSRERKYMTDSIEKMNMANEIEPNLKAELLAGLFKAQLS